MGEPAWSERPLGDYLAERGVASRGAAEYEVQRLRVDHTWSRNAIRRLLTERAEYGGWELYRLRRYRNGARDIWVRRKVIRMRATF